tara:strand:+ start:298 stop:576 length:279 start_codon:yes stop_codon:yes gene_type:complete
MKDLEKYLDEAITNIRDDRAMASNLLVDLVGVLKTDPSKHQYTGQVAAKYLETLQRSNEQLVKITAMLQKREAATSMTELDKEEIYDLIKGE